MQALSILRSRLTSTVISPLLSRGLPRVGMTAYVPPSSSSSIPQINNTTCRSVQSEVWSEVIRQVPSDDPNKAGQLTFEDPDLADARMLRTIRSEGECEVFIL